MPSQTAVLNNIVGNLESPSPKTKDRKMARFGLRVASSMIFAGKGALLIHSILSKIVGPFLRQLAQNATFQLTKALLL